tara:strand:- start:170 stop:589 length:420 start_codon:yes stop_codon:yes gene_type:complete
MHETARGCPSCGNSQVVSKDSSLKSQTAAGLWCFFLGGFGAHRFYLGKIASGVFYLLFFWTSIPALIACIEMILIAFTNPERWDEKYNGGRPTPPAHWFIKILAFLAPVMFFAGLLAGILAPAYQDYVERTEQMQMQMQ